MNRGGDVLSAGRGVWAYLVGNGEQWRPWPERGKPDDILRMVPCWPWGSMEKAGTRFRERGKGQGLAPPPILIP